MGERAMFILFPELADESPSYIAGLTFSEEAEANMQAIAVALAEERAKARAPFLALAEELAEQGHRFAAMPDPYAMGLGDARISAANRIRRAAEDTP
jgi:hypothetical protein